MRPGPLLLLLLVLAAAGGIVLFVLDDGPGRPDGPGQTGAEPAAEPGSALRGEVDGDRVVAEPPAREKVDSPARTPATRGDKIALIGRLVQDNGAPAIGEKVRFAPRFEPGTLMVDNLDDLDPLTDGEETETDREGAFRFLIDPGKAGWVRLVDSAHVFADGTPGRSVPAADEDIDLGAIALVSGGVIAGHVRDQDGVAVADVEVWLGQGLIGPRAGVRAAKTDATGHFELAGLAAGKHALRTISPRHAPATLEVELATSQRREDIVLTVNAGGEIAGVVVDDLRRPIAGARVGAFRERETGEGMTVRSMAEGEMVVTDAAGRFSLGGIQDPVSVRARAEGHKASSVAGVAAGQRDVVVVMPRTASVEGVLVDEAGAPIAGSIIRGGLASSGLLLREQVSATTNAEGRFVLDDVNPGSVRLEAVGEGHLRVSQSLEVKPGVRNEGVRIVAARGATLRVAVVDPTGQPVEGAEVKVRAAQPGGSGTMRYRVGDRVRAPGGDTADHVLDLNAPRRLGKATTDQDGVATISGLPAGRAVIHTTHAVHAAAGDQETEIPTAGVVDATVALRPAGAVTITVVDPDGAPVTGVGVRIEGPLGDEKPGTRKVSTDENGVAAVARLPVGSYAAVIVAAQRPMQFGGATVVIGGQAQVQESTRQTFSVAAGGQVDVRLQQPVMTTVAGTLYDADGPVVGGKIRLREEGRPTLPGAGPSARTDEEGRFSIPNVTEGKYLLTYGRRRQVVSMEEKLVVAGERRIEKQLMLRGGSIKVTVRSQEDAEPLARATVSVRRPSGDDGAPRPRMAFVNVIRTGDGGGGEESVQFGGAPTTVKTDEDGVAVVEDVPPGEYVVVVEHPRHITQRVKDVQVADGESRDLGSLDLVIGGMLRGQVVEADGNVTMVASVRLERIGDDGEPRPTTAMQGGFRYTGLHPGRYNVSARGLGPGLELPWSDPQPVEIRAGESARVTVKLPAR